MASLMLPSSARNPVAACGGIPSLSSPALVCRLGTSSRAALSSLKRPNALRSVSISSTGSFKGSVLSSSWMAGGSLSVPSSSPERSSNREPRSVAVRSRNGDSVDAVQRIIAASGYLLPFLDGAKYGRYLYLQYPLFRTLLDPIAPLIQLYNGLPFAGFIAFFALYLGVIQNPNMSRYVRVNCMQAVILDILMILPALFERLFTFRDGVGFQLTVVFYNTVFLYLFACFLFGVGSCLLGKNPRLPLVADAAEAQVPF